MIIEISDTAVSAGTHWALSKSHLQSVNIEGYPVENKNLGAHSASWYQGLDNWGAVDYQELPHGNHRALETCIFPPAAAEVRWAAQMSLVCG